MAQTDPDWRRRRLLQAFATLPLAALLSGCQRSSLPAGAALPVAPLTPKDTVLIIGAGMAGLTAANALNNAGIRNIVIEGRDRIGGRLFTKNVGGTLIDLGASWIHNPDGGNPMTAFANAAGIGYTPADPVNDAATINYCDAVSSSSSQALRP